MKFMSDSIRQPAGQPTGGQFATHNRADADVSLPPRTHTLSANITSLIHEDNLPDLPDYPAALPEPTVALDFNDGPRAFIVVGEHAFNFWTGSDDETFTDFHDQDTDWDEETADEFVEWGYAVQARLDSIVYDITVTAFAGSASSDAVSIATGR